LSCAQPVSLEYRRPFLFTANQRHRNHPQGEATSGAQITPYWLPRDNPPPPPRVCVTIVIQITGRLTFTELRASRNTMKHIHAKRPEISEEMIQRAFQDPYSALRVADRGRKVVLGDDGDGRLLAIVAYPRGTVLHLITCRPMTRREAAHYRERKTRRFG
jgi:uncharacterized DUF497 family protein